MNNLFQIEPTSAVKPVVKSARPKNMQQGHADDFQTPSLAIAPLLPYLHPEWRIWEPCCGMGNLVRGLCDSGHDTFGTDIKTGQDALTWEPEHFDALVTNPPFSCKDAMIARCYELGKPFALLLPFAVLEGQKRQALYRQHGLELIVLDRRLNFETPNRVAKSSAWFATAWFTWGLGIGQQITFAELPK